MRVYDQGRTSEVIVAQDSHSTQGLHMRNSGMHSRQSHQASCEGNDKIIVIHFYHQ